MSRQTSPVLRTGLGMLATDLHARLNAIFADYNRSDSPGCTVAVSLRGSVVFRAAFGLASVEHGVANLPSTRMPVGSVTKQFTCAAILLLAEDGSLDIDDAIGRFMPELPEAQRKPTLRQLMNHTGGLRCYLDQWMYNGFQTMPPGYPERMQQRQTEANFAPGRGSSYCNGGYLLLSRVIEQVAGMSLESFLRDRLFEPLGMHTTRLKRSPRTVEQGLATTYMRVSPDSPNEGLEAPWLHGIAISHELLGEGGVVSTVDDLLRWTAHLRTSRGVISLAHMTPPTVFADGESSGYSFGLISERWRGLDLVQHAGGLLGANSNLLMAPSAELDVAILFNQNAPAIDLGLKVVAVILGEQLEPPQATPRSELYRDLLGDFVAPETGFLFGFHDLSGELGLSLFGGPASKLEHRVSANALPLYADVGTGSIRFRRVNSASTAQAIEYSDGGPWQRAERVSGPRPPPRLILERCAGSYSNLDVGASMTFEVVGDSLVLRLRGEYGAMTCNAEPIAPDLVRIWAPGLLSGALATLQGGAGGTHSVLISTPRTRRTVFTSGVSGEAW